MRTKFTGAAGRTSCICISAHHSFCGYCNRYKYAMGRNHKRVNRITALSSLLLHIILLRDKLKKRFIFTLKNLIDKHIMILIAVISLGAIGAIGAVFLYAASKKFEVYEDPRIAQVQEVLPGANCGGCGYPGCGGFATACVKADTLTACYAP